MEEFGSFPAEPVSSAFPQGEGCAQQGTNPKDVSHSAPEVASSRIFLMIYRPL